MCGSSLMNVSRQSMSLSTRPGWSSGAQRAPRLSLGSSGASGRNVAALNLRGGYRIQLPRGRTLDAFVDVFNAPNRANFQNPSGDRRTASTFLILTATDQSTPARSAQINLRYGF